MAEVSLPTYETLLTEAIRSLAIDSGTVTVSPPAGVAVLQDDTKSWPTDVHRGRLVKVIRGAGAGQLRIVLSNSDKLLTLNQAWTVPPGAGSVYVILGVDFAHIAQILRDVFGGGADISAANPLQVFDPKIWGSVSALVLQGTVTAIPGANQFTIPTLAGLGAGRFAGVIAPYRAFVARDAGGAGAAPQGEQQAITAYVTATGVFTTNAFTAPVGVGDGILILHPRLAEILDIQTAIGAIEGGTDLHNKLTAARAVLLDRLALLAAGGAGELTPGRATNLDNLDAAVSSRAVPGDAMALTPAERLIVQALLLSDATPFAGADIDAAISSRALEDGGRLQNTESAVGAIEGATALHNKLTAARAALLDEITALRMAELDAANIPGDVDTLKAAIGAIEGATALHNKLTAARAALLDRIALLAAGGAGELTAARAVALQRLIDDLTAARAGYLDNINQAGLLQLTAARAGYLDNLSAGAAALQASLARVQPSIKLWSAYTNQIVLTTVAGDKALQNITIAGLPAGAIVTRAIIYFKFGGRENTNAAVNSISGAQNIQVQKAVAGAYITGIALGGGEYSTIASSGVVSGDVMMGINDVSAQVPANGAVMNAKWTSALAAQNNLNFNDIQWGIEIWFTV